MPTAYKILRKEGIYLKSMMHASPDLIYLPVRTHWQRLKSSALFVFDSLYAAQSILETFSDALYRYWQHPYWIFEVKTERLVHCGMALSNSNLNQADLQVFWKNFSWSNGSCTRRDVPTYATPLGTSVTPALQLVRPLAIYRSGHCEITPADLESICWEEENV